MGSVGEMGNVLPGEEERTACERQRGTGGGELSGKYCL